MVLLLPWLLHSEGRPEYAGWSGRDSGLGIDDARETGRMLLLLVAARFTFNALLRGPTQRLAERRGAEKGHRDGRHLLEEVYVTIGNVGMLAGALFVMLHRNGGCWFFDTSTCLAGWPNLPAEPAARRYYCAELAWYCHMLLKPVLRYGLTDGRDMLLHHVATVALIVVSYCTNLTRLGVLVLACFAISNPLLHFAKICNQLSLGSLKIGGFVLFALAFFLSRVLLVPVAVLKATLFDSRRDIPYAVEDFGAVYWGFNALLLGLYALQLMWMRGILRVLSSAAQHGSDAASNMSAQIDPAKRYATTSSSAGEGPLSQQPLPRRLNLPKTPSPVDLPAIAAAHEERVLKQGKAL